MVSLIHFKGVALKWLESACSAVVLGDLCNLYDGIGIAGARVYAGRFTLLKSDHFSQKAIAVQRTHHSASGTLPNYHIKGGGGSFHSKNKISYIRV